MCASVPSRLPLPRSSLSWVWATWILPAQGTSHADRADSVPRAAASLPPLGGGSAVAVTGRAHLSQESATVRSRAQRNSRSCVRPPDDREANEQAAERDGQRRPEHSARSG